LLWFTTFVDRGILKTDDEARSIITNINLVQTVGSLLIFIFAGRFADKYPFYITLTSSFVMRAGALAAFIFIVDEADSLLTYAVVFLLQLGALL
jgi:hypothetical protein